MLIAPNQPFATLPRAQTAQAYVEMQRKRWKALQDSRSAKHNAIRAELRTVNLFAGYHPHAKQCAFHKSVKRFKALCAGRRSGKTYSAVREFLKRIWQDYAAAKAAGLPWYDPGAIKEHTQPLLHYWAVAPTYQLGLVQQREISSILAPHQQLIRHWAGNRLWLQGGILITFRSADNPQSLVADRINGQWWDEVARCKRLAWIDNARPALSDTGGWALFSTTPLGANWFYDDIWTMPEKPGVGHEYGSFHWTTADNIRVPKLAKEVEEAKATMPKAMFARNYLASFDAFEGQIYEEFDKSIHVVKSIPYGLRHIGAQDWGYSNPGVFLEIATDSERYFITRENYHKRMNVRAEGGVACWANIATEAQRRRQCGTVWCDPARPEYIEQYCNVGLDAQGAHNAVTEGIDTLSALLHPHPSAGPRLFIHESCEHTIREFQGYRYATDKHGTSTEAPEKVNDHCPDAGRYGIHSDSLELGTAPCMTYLSLHR